MPGGTTTRLGLPYPLLTDGPDGADVPYWIQALATALDVAAIDDQGVLASRPVSTSGSPGKKGRYYMVKGDPDTTQNGILYRDNGTGWDAVNIILPTTVTTADLADGAVTTAKIAANAVGTAQLAAGAVGTTQIASKAVTSALVADALKPSAGAADATEALRAIGSSAGNVVAGNDSRLAIISNSSTGTAGSAVVLATSPALTGTPTAPTPATADNTTKIATTAYVQNQGYALLASPTFTGTPAAPTPVSSDNSTKLATTAYVQAQAYAPLASPTFTGTPAAPTAATATNTTQIATTAFVKAQAYATDSLVVHLANTETVSGIKAFSAGPRWSTQSVSGTATLVDGTAAVVLADTTPAAFTLTLPSAPTAGSWFRIIDSAAQFATHNLTVARNGKTIDGAASNVVLNANNSVLELYYDGTGWRTTETGVFAGGDLTGSFPSPTIKGSVGLTGTPTAPTAAAGDNSTQIATTAFVKAQAYATLASPTFTGTPAAPTAAGGTNTTQIATTAFVAASFAPIASPTFTGTPAAPTAVAGTNTTQLATTAFVAASFAPLASPTFTGTPAAPTAATATNTTQIATTAFVKAQAYAPLASPAFTGTPTAPAWIAAFSANAAQAVGTVTPNYGVAQAYEYDFTSGTGTVTIATPTNPPGAGQTGFLSIQVSNDTSGSVSVSWGSYVFSTIAKPTTLAVSASFTIVFIWINSTWLAIAKF